MRYELSKNLIRTIKNAHKNPDYSLGCFVDGIDVDSCGSLYEIAENISLGDETESIEISDRTVNNIKNIFGYCNRDLIEVLVWISAFLPEI